MSDDSFFPAQPALVTPERARDIARSYKALADQFSEAGMLRQANIMTRDSQWWLTYAITLAQVPPEPTA